MYLPPHFAVTEPAALHGILQAHPLGTLVRAGSQGLDADHIPFEFDATATTAAGLGRLSAHVARANPLWTEARDALASGRAPQGLEVLVIFRGAEAYVSPNWYPSKHEAHRQVPTWNYEVVHAHGHLKVVDDERFVRGLLARLTRHHEAPEPRPWKMGDSAPAFIDELLAKVVGIEVDITRLVGKSKLSQNKESRDRAGAAEKLAERGEDALAQAMLQTLSGG